MEKDPLEIKLPLSRENAVRVVFDRMPTPEELQRMRMDLYDVEERWKKAVPPEPEHTEINGVPA